MPSLFSHYEWQQDAHHQHVVNDLNLSVNAIKSPDVQCNSFLLSCPSVNGGVLLYFWEYWDRKNSSFCSFFVYVHFQPAP